MDMYFVLDEIYSSVGSAMCHYSPIGSSTCHVDDLPVETQKAAEEKVLEIKRLTEELEKLLKDTP